MDNTKPEVGKAVADFLLTGGDGCEYQLSEYKGKKNVLLFFYAKDNTSG